MKALKTGLFALCLLSPLAVMSNEVNSKKYSFEAKSNLTTKPCFFGFSYVSDNGVGHIVINADNLRYVQRLASSPNMVRVAYINDTDLILEFPSNDEAFDKVNEIVNNLSNCQAEFKEKYSDVLPSSKKKIH